ncbi:MAG: hypothetical protein VX346_05205 [Planctomycetota bacterium]|nr:hypothetical protein [Planctomycetota bacterium]
MKRLTMFLVLGLAVTIAHLPVSTNAAEKTKISLAKGKITLKVTDKWIRKKPKSRILEYEFAVPAIKPDRLDGRVTIMGASGGVKVNIDRWKGQFRNPSRKPKVEKHKVSGQTVHYVDAVGTYLPPPFTREKQIPKARMLGAIVETEKYGLQFIKLYGPEATITAHEKAFLSMLKSLVVTK